MTSWRPRRYFEAEIQRQEGSEAGWHGPDAAPLLRQSGYLLECHGRITIRRAIEQYQRSIDLGPDDDQVQYQWIGAKATLDEAEDAITRYREWVAASPWDVRELRFPAHAYLAAKDFDAAKGVIDTGLALAADDGGRRLGSGALLGTAIVLAADHRCHSGRYWQAPPAEPPQVGWLKPCNVL